MARFKINLEFMPEKPNQINEGGNLDAGNDNDAEVARFFPWTVSESEHDKLMMGDPDARKPKKQE